MKKADPAQTKSGNFNDKEMLRSDAPAANRSPGDTSPPAGREYPAGDRGIHSGSQQRQDEQVKGKPGKARS